MSQFERHHFNYLWSALHTHPGHDFFLVVDMLHTNRAQSCDRSPFHGRPGSQLCRLGFGRQSQVLQNPAMCGLVCGGMNEHRRMP